MEQPKRAGLTDEDLAGIRNTSDRFAHLMREGDFPALVALYTEDAVLMPPNHPRVEGRERIREFMNSLSGLSRFEINLDDIDGRDDMAYVRGSYSMTIHPEGAPGPVDDEGKFLEIRKRQSDGTFHLAVDIFNSDLG